MLKHEINTILVALLTAQGVFEKFKKGQKLSQREKVLCLVVFVNAMIVTQNIYDRETARSLCRRGIGNGLNTDGTLGGGKV